MRFITVYCDLMELFPQVDVRVLKAVAIENPNDAEKAVEVVFKEVIPNIASTSGSSNDSSNNASHEENYAYSVSENLDENVDLFNVSACDNANGDGDRVCESVGKQVVSTVKSSIASEPSQTKDVLLTNSNCCDNASSNLVYFAESNLEQLCSNVNSMEGNTTEMNLSPPTGLDCTSFASENVTEHSSDVAEGIKFFDAFPHITVKEVLEFENEPVEDKFTNGLVEFEHVDVENISTCVVDDVEDEYTLNTEITRSDEICRIDLLEDIITEARDNKKTLFLAMESVISLMRKVEEKEKEAEQVKEEAARGPVGILASVDELKQMLSHAREANDMHSGEVYGEKAILATEAKELQSRLICLSDERDNSLAILDEMRQTLEQRLDAAEKAMEAAEEEMMEKEELARNALAEQQLIMEKLVEKSRILKQEAEENSQLQEFLMDRGRLVDTLQGEISVICQDVKLLKQKFDERVPLSESLSSSQTSCRLASLSSSVKSLPLDHPIQIETEHLSSKQEIEAKNRDALVNEDGWEFYDSKDLGI